MNDKIMHSDQLKNGIWPLSLPLWVAAFYVALFIIRPWEQFFPEWGIIHIERIYGIFMILIVLISRKRQLQFTFEAVTVLLFLVAMVMSAFFAYDPQLAWNSVYEYATLVIFFFVLVVVIRNPYELVFMVICYMVVMAVYLAKAQWEFFAHGQGVYDMGVWRLTGIENTFGGPNELAMAIVISLPFVIFLRRFRSEVSSAWPNFWRKIFPLFIVFYFVLATSSVILTNSRSGMLGIVLFVALIVFEGRDLGKKLKYVLVGAIFLAIIWYVMPAEHKGRMRTMWEPESGPVTALHSAEGRVEGFDAGITMFKRFPLTGVGIGNFMEYRVSYLDGVRLNAHNLVGQILGEMGLIGFMAFLLLVITILVNYRRVRALSKNSSVSTLKVLSGLVVACRDSLILLAFLGLFGHNLYLFNWLWLAAFSSLALQYTMQNLKEKDLRK